MNHKSSPLISIIIAVFNGVKTLQQCIDSVVQQGYANKELIIIDGGSKDGTVDLLKSNSEHISYWISEPDRGIYQAWNKGLLHAKGDWICFLGVDDYFWNNHVLEHMSDALQNVPPDVRLAYAQIMLLDANGESLFAIGEPWEKIRDRFKQGLCLPHPGLMHRRSLFERNGNFDESFRIAGDYELMLRELKTAEAVFIPGIITIAMRTGGISSNPANSLLSLKEIRLAQRMHGQYFPSLFWLRAMIRIYMRLLLWNSLGETKARKLLDLGRRMKGLPAYWTRA
ncbi:MAG TPA: glycosyltransferase family 2 protein [Smithellaceae bacterium]|mgnify:CR=1 FL=1|nr:glycosyltransferase family 2 protein [Smithellaceae bacterium]HPL67655.1 glycosyltransferase family 2 protein [Smithellaceae bacterium]